MNFTLRILPRAERDVQSIFEYIGQRSPQGAHRWWNAFQEAAVRTARHPRQYPSAPEDSTTDVELRQFLFKTRRGRTYRAVFAIVENEVRILRVRGPGQPPLTEDELTP